MPSRPRLGDQEEENDKEDQSDPEGVVHAQSRTIIEDILELISRFLADTGCDSVGISVAVYHVRNAPCDKHGSQRRDKGRQFELAHQKTVHHAADQTAGKGYQNSNNRMHASAHQRRRHHSAHTHHGTDGQVNVSGDQYVTLRDTDQQVL